MKLRKVNQISENISIGKHEIWKIKNNPVYQRFYSAKLSIISYLMKGVFGTDHRRICWEITEQEAAIGSYS